MNDSFDEWAEFRQWREIELLNVEHSQRMKDLKEWRKLITEKEFNEEERSREEWKKYQSMKWYERIFKEQPRSRKLTRELNYSMMEHIGSEIKSIRERVTHIDVESYLDWKYLDQFKR